MSLTKTSRIPARRPAGCICRPCRCGMGARKANCASNGNGNGNGNGKNSSNGSSSSSGNNANNSNSGEKKNT
ncbi:hypothetical protein VDP57_18470 [Xanthomonas campestris pv. campestris]|uniref:hypothetical protein n=1 Tax=Xanthomonas campestris TaxID=339 RepID=UPI002A6812B8|nr:hypothetical protein [Xanthomonas campestris pv. campestris]MEB1349291.1 hypothetical protein [Xanthomonas campestris pv. campestris]